MQFKYHVVTNRYAYDKNGKTNEQIIDMDDKCVEKWNLGSVRCCRYELQIHIQRNYVVKLPVLTLKANNSIQVLNVAFEAFDSRAQ